MWLLAPLYIHLLSAQTQDDLHRTRPVELTGVIRATKHWGPPGFGETPSQDVRHTVYSIRLRKAWTAQQGVRYREVQIRCEDSTFPKCLALVKQSLRKEITVIGEAAFAVYPTDYFPVAITVRTIRKKH